MIDAFGRDINYLRISITDRCNLRCKYCMPETGVKNLGHGTILKLEDFARLVKVGTQVGIRKVRITGGEPLVRKNVVKLVADIAELDKIDDIAITTNGVLYADMAEDLKRAGLNRINFSLDTLDRSKFNFISRRDNLAQVKKAIFKALELDMHPVKINTVLIKGFNDDEIMDFIALSRDYPLHIRFIEFMPVGDLLFWDKDKMMSSQQIKEIIETENQLISIKSIKGNGPAKYYQVAGGKGTVGFISPMSNHFCSECNRLRMTADGKLRGCLYAKQEIDLKAALARGANDEELRDLFRQAIDKKPERHHFDEGWGEENRRKMFQIGG
ncbi:MAG: GTP 3',8-cyclase MoaA [Syntrophomonadaceae bacterium]|jgi:cyclic pyranopterin phosphate synthase